MALLCTFLCTFSHLFALIDTFCTFVTPFNTFGTFLKHTICGYFILFIWVTSWDSVPILMCYLMQAPH